MAKILIDGKEFKPLRYTKLKSAAKNYARRARTESGLNARVIEIPKTGYHPSNANWLVVTHKRK